MEKDKLLIGRKPVLDALEQSVRLEKLWIDKDLRGELEKHIRKMARENRTPLQYVPKQKLAALASNANHQGIVAQLAIVEYYTTDELVPLLYEQGRVPFLLVLDGIEDVRNIGALARSAVWFDCDGIVVPFKKTALINSFTYKTSAGAIKDIHICRENNLKTALEYMKASGIQLVAADMPDNSDSEKIDLNEPIALILGSEGKGVSREILSIADHTLSIPGTKRVESLNVSVAGAILMSQIYNSRHQ